MDCMNVYANKVRLEDLCHYYQSMFIKGCTFISAKHASSSKRSSAENVSSRSRDMNVIHDET